MPQTAQQSPNGSVDSDDISDRRTEEHDGKYLKPVIKENASCSSFSTSFGDPRVFLLGNSKELSLKEKYHADMMSFENPKTFFYQQKQINSCLVLL